MLVRIWCAITWLSWIAATPASAAPAKPTPAQLERAKKAFADAKKLHDAGKLTEAVEKLKASYELSNNPLLLYNIGLTMQELGSDDLAVIYYRKFLAEAPADATQRAEATDRIAAITRKLSPEPPPQPVAPPPPVITPPPEDRAAQALGHHPIEAAPPDKPLDVTAQVAPEAGLTVTLFVRAAGEPTFTATPMIRRQRELVGRIPAARMTSTSVQYYLEARDATGAVTARSGKPSSPNVIALDVTASTQFYPDISDPPVPRSGDREDPLHREAPPVEAGPRVLGYAKWSATAVAGVGLGLGVTMYFLARDHAAALEDDARACGTPPCQAFDAFDRDLQRTGQREQTIANVALIGGAAATLVAGYFWYRALTDRPHAKADAGKLARSWQVAPALGAGYAGASAAVGF